MKLFPLVKEIKSKTGVLHFRRWRILELPKFRVYLHNITESDLDEDEHTHPWNFASFILKGGYWEASLGRKKLYKPGSVVKRSFIEPHKITLIKPTWTLVIAWGRRQEWGYMTKQGWVDHITYRKLKNENRV